MKLPFQQVLDALSSSTSKRVTKYLSPKLTLKATRQRKIDGRDRGVTFVVSVGSPNHRERAFIKLAQKAKEPFPIRKLIHQPFPTKRRG